jgi:hypothetical protein
MRRYFVASPLPQCLIAPAWLPHPCRSGRADDDQACSRKGRQRVLRRHDTSRYAATRIERLPGPPASARPGRLVRRPGLSARAELHTSGTRLSGRAAKCALLRYSDPTEAARQLGPLRRARSPMVRKGSPVRVRQRASAKSPLVARLRDLVTRFGRRPAEHLRNTHPRLGHALAPVRACSGAPASSGSATDAGGPWRDLLRRRLSPAGGCVFRRADRFQRRTGLAATRTTRPRRPCGGRRRRSSREG